MALKGRECWSIGPFYFIFLSVKNNFDWYDAGNAFVQKDCSVALLIDSPFASVELQFCLSVYSSVHSSETYNMLIIV